METSHFTDYAGEVKEGVSCHSLCRQRHDNQTDRATLLPGKIFAGFVVLMMTFGGVTGYIVWEVRQLGMSLEKLYTSLVPLPSLVAELKGDYRRISLTVGLTGKEATATRSSTYSTSRQIA